MEEELLCPICLEVLQEPSTLPCGHTYCLQCIREHLAAAQRRDCPLCNAAVPHGYQPRVSIVARRLVQAVLEAQAQQAAAQVTAELAAQARAQQAAAGAVAAAAHAPWEVAAGSWQQSAAELASQARSRQAAATVGIEAQRQRPEERNATLPSRLEGRERRIVAGFVGELDGELSVTPGERVTVHSEVEGWARITRLSDNLAGLVPNWVVGRN